MWMTSPIELPNLSSMSEGMNVVIMEDHPLYLEGLKAYLAQRFPDMNMLYTGASFLDVKSVLEENTIQIAIVDLHLGDGRSPSEIVGFFSSREVPVLVISALNNFESVRSAFSMGALGFVSKDSAIDDIGKAIKNVLLGRQWISPVLGKTLDEQNSVADRLSTQERKAIILYASGLKLEVVARRMNVAPSTVKQYIDRAKDKFKSAGIHVSTKTELYKVLRDLSLID